MSKDVKTVGGLLLAARLNRGQSIESIADDICVRSCYLAAIESNDYKELPEKTFAVGFVRAYAAALGLNDAKIVEQFKEEYGEPACDTALSSDINLAATPRRMPTWLSPLAGVAGVALCWALFGGSVVPFSVTASNQQVDAQTDVAQLQAVQATLPASTATRDVVAARADEAVYTPAGDAELASAQTEDAPFVDASTFFSTAANAGQSAAAQVGGAAVMLEATEDAWVRLANPDGTEIWSGVLREGQRYRPQLEGIALLSTSNAGGISVTMGDERLAALGQRGEVVTDMRLEGERKLTALDEAGRDAAGSR